MGLQYDIHCAMSHNLRVNDYKNDELAKLLNMFGEELANPSTCGLVRLIEICDKHEVDLQSFLLVLRQWLIDYRILQEKPNENDFNSNDDISPIISDGEPTDTVPSIQ